MLSTILESFWCLAAPFELLGQGVIWFRAVNPPWCHFLDGGQNYLGAFYIPRHKKSASHSCSAIRTRFCWSISNCLWKLVFNSSAKKMPLSLECVSDIDLCVECLLYQYFVYAPQLENSLLEIVTADTMREKQLSNSASSFRLCAIRKESLL